MNFLAHGFLSRGSDLLLVGNFIGDFVKGKQMNNYDPEIIRGIQLHRKIDEFTDSHPVVIRSKNRIRPVYGHYTGVIIDLFYDHFLANGWNSWCDEPLASFCSRVYNIILAQVDILPEEARRMIPWMVEHNWLLSYSTIEGIDRSLKGLSRRTPFKSGMENAAEDLRTLYSGFSEDFNEFFPELIRFVETV